MFAVSVIPIQQCIQARIGNDERNNSQVETQTKCCTTLQQSTRSVPFSPKGAVEQEIYRLEELGVLEHVLHSEWAAPIVVVPKKDGCVRLYGDYKETVNTYLDVDQYPLPKPNELFATLTGGKDLQSWTCHRLTPRWSFNSRCYVTINTHIGLFCYTRLPFGVASSPALFQVTMDSILQGISSVICYIHDILITSKSDEGPGGGYEKAGSSWSSVGEGKVFLFQGSS